MFELQRKQTQVHYFEDQLGMAEQKYNETLLQIEDQAYIIEKLYDFLRQLQHAEDLINESKDETNSIDEPSKDYD